MSFEQTMQGMDETRPLFEKLFPRLPQVPFDSKWINAKGQLTPAVEAARLTEPSSSIEPASKRRLILIPTHRFGTIVMFDKWGDRGANGPVDAIHPIGFDMIDYPFEMMAVSADQVADDFDTTSDVTETEGLTPVFGRLLREVSTGTGTMVRFH